VTLSEFAHHFGIFQLSMTGAVICGSLLATVDTIQSLIIQKQQTGIFYYSEKLARKTCASEFKSTETEKVLKQQK
jgi:hypothetical protein